MNPPTLSLDELRDPEEKTAWLVVLFAAIPVWLLIGVGVTAFLFGTSGFGLLVFPLFWLVSHLGQLFAAAYIKTNAVRLSPQQLPEIYEFTREAAERLGMAPPDVYVIQHNVWNAFAVKLAGRRLVVLFSGAVDSLMAHGQAKELRFLIGHELGHHVAGHLDRKHTWVVCGAWMIWAYLWYHRRRELTCDRIGLYCAGSLNTAQAAMTNLTVGAQLTPHVNVDAAIAQWEEHKREFFVRYRILYSSYPPLLCRLAALRDAATSLGIPD
jgi:Zn-dependent protease with chaperone function